MWPFKKRKEEQLPILPFKSGSGFFEYWCKFGENRLAEDNPILGLVLDSREIAGAEDAVSFDPNGCQTAMLRIASDNGGFEVLAQTAGPGELLQPGELVMWLPGQYLPKLAAVFPDPRGGWVGLIIAKVAAELNPNTNQFRAICSYGRG